jgi:rSAM/selenodomain-associated transferase 1
LEEIVIVFTKYPEEGKVKTRLAKSVGDTAAVEIYKRLLHHTEKQLIDSKKKYVVYWGNYIPTNSIFFSTASAHYLQCEGDLGEKMKTAFEDQFSIGYSAVYGIGCDCYEFSSEHLKEASNVLKHYDVAYGPALDGGYYLMGMNNYYSFLFDDLPWSTEQLLEICKQRLNTNSVSFDVITPVSDVDYYEDLPQIWKDEFRV